MVRELLLLEGDQRIDVHAWSDAAFQLACESGRENIVALLLSLDGDRYIDVHMEDGAAFRGTCQRGHATIAQQLLSLGGDRRIDVHASNGFDGFHLACRFGHAGIVELLLALDGDRRIDVHAQDEAVFRNACRKGNLTLLDMLLALPSERGYAWETKQQQTLLLDCVQCVDCTMRVSTEQQNAAFMLLQRVPLPPSSLRLLMARRYWEPVALLDLEPQGVAVVQQVLLVLSTLHPTSPYRLLRKLGMCRHGANRNAVLDALALCCVLLPPAHSAALEAALVATAPGSVEDVDDFLRGLVWTGLRLPLVHAPGVHLLAAQAGGLGRVGRRGLLLHRAAARGARAEERARLKAARLGEWGT